MKRMMVKGLLMVLISGLCVGASWGQSVTSMSRNNDVDYGRAFRFNVKSDGVKGTPFLYEEPMSANIALMGGKVYEGIPFNIFPEKEEIYIQTGGEESEPLILKNWEWLKTLEEQPKLFRLEYLEGKQRIVEILYEKEKDYFVALHTKYLVKPSNLKDGYTGPQYDTYKPEVRFYIISGLKSTEIKTNNAGLKELAGDKYSELRSFIKSEKLKPNLSYDMKRILEFLMD
jgi:hypothetical protein